MYDIHPEQVYITDWTLRDERAVARAQRLAAAFGHPEPPVLTAAELVAVAHERGWLTGAARTGAARQAPAPDIVLSAFTFDEAEVQARLREYPALRPWMLAGHGPATLRDGPEQLGIQGTVCQTALEIHCAYGCFHACDYCHIGSVFNIMTNLEAFAAHVRQLVRENPWCRLWKFDNYTDTITLEPEYGASEVMVNQFATEPDAFLMLYTKSANVDHLLDLDHRGRTLISWSLGSDTASRVSARRRALRAVRSDCRPANGTAGPVNGAPRAANGGPQTAGVPRPANGVPLAANGTVRPANGAMPAGAGAERPANGASRPSAAAAGTSVEDFFWADSEAKAGRARQSGGTAPRTVVVPAAVRTGPAPAGPAGRPGAPNGGPPGGGAYGSGAGDEPPRRGRLLPIIVLAFIAVALLIGLLIALGGGDDGSGGPSASPSVSATPSPSQTSPSFENALDEGSAVRPPDFTVKVPGTTSVDFDTYAEITMQQGLFDSGSTTISDWGKNVLKQVAAQIEANKAAGLIVLVVGHTDTVPFRDKVGPYTDNVSLGMARSIAVIEYMREQSGLPYKIFAAATADGSNPIDTNDTERGRARNRTVVIKLMQIVQSGS